MGIQVPPRDEIHEVAYVALNNSLSGLGKVFETSYPRMKRFVNVFEGTIHSYFSSSHSCTQQSVSWNVAMSDLCLFLRSEVL